MEHFAGLDVSVKETSVCILDDAGKIVKEVKVASEPQALLGVSCAALSLHDAAEDSGRRGNACRRGAISLGSVTSRMRHRFRSSASDTWPAIQPPPSLRLPRQQT